MFKKQYEGIFMTNFLFVCLFKNANALIHPLKLGNHAVIVQ